MSQTCKSWIIDKFGWSSTTFNFIAWSAYNNALTKFKGHQNSIWKVIHGWLPVVEPVCKYNSQKITKCLWCQDRERQDHVLCCPDMRASEVCLDNLTTLWESFTKDTKPTLLALIQQQVCRWIQNQEYTSPHVGNPYLDAILQQQNWIGKEGFHEGQNCLLFH